MGYVIKRSEVKEIKKIPGWILIYGRRKVGKTFLAKNFLDYDEYYLVRRDLKIINEKERGFIQFLEEVKKNLKNEKTIVVDEFQRLPESFVDEIAQMHPSGKLILLGSSLRILSKIFSVRSPLLGLIAEYKLDLLNPKDLFKFFKGLELDPIGCIELSTYLREPWLITYLPVFKGDIVKFLYEVMKLTRNAIKALIGEVFSEEERELTKRYESILNLLGSGCWSTKEMVGILYNRRVIDRPDISLIKQYLLNLIEMDLVEKVEITNRREKFFKIKSAFVDLYYYLNERYGLEEMPRFKEIKNTIKVKSSFHLQDFVADCFSILLEGKKCYFMAPTKEIDFLIKGRGKTLCVGEVKWKDRVRKNDLLRFKESSEGITGRKIFFSKFKPFEMEGIEIWDPKKLIDEFYSRF